MTPTPGMGRAQMAPPPLPQPRWGWWLVTIVIGGSLVLAFYALFLTASIRNQQLHDRGRTTDATIVGIIGAPQELHGALSAEVQFRLPTGTVEQARLDVPATNHVGDRIAVVYDPAAPSVVALPFQAQGSTVSRFWGPVVGLLAICSIAVLLYSMRRRQQAKTLGRTRTRLDGDWPELP